MTFLAIVEKPLAAFSKLQNIFTLKIYKTQKPK